MRPTHLALLAALVPALAFATDVSDELNVTGTQATPTNPQTGSVSDRIAANFDLSDTWVLNADITLTHQAATPASTAAIFPDSGGTVFDLGLGAEWDATDTWTFTANADLSPSSTTSSNTQLTLDTPTLTSASADAQLRTVASSSGLMLGASWTSAGQSNFESAVDLTLGGNRFKSNQRITAIESRTGQPISAGGVYTYCKRIAASTSTDLRTRYAKALCQQILPTLDPKGKDATLGQLTVGATYTATLYQDTDVGLGLTYFGYSEDPTQVGFFTLATSGRHHVEMGDGVPVAPLRWSMRPEVVHRFGDLTADLWYEHGQYVSGQGRSEMIGLKLAYRFSKTYRAWLSGSGQNDVDGQDNSTRSGSFAAGLRVTF